ncbi:MAG TPA: hypothetical protein VK978_00975 [Candidatus Saccharimonadales bacterium]|nr:hypothetical protein [Candidatus Saccharimonadales bacterium]
MSSATPSETQEPTSTDGQSAWYYKASDLLAWFWLHFGPAITSFSFLIIGAGVGFSAATSHYEKLSQAPIVNPDPGKRLDGTAPTPSDPNLEPSWPQCYMQLQFEGITTDASGYGLLLTNTWGNYRVNKVLDPSSLPFSELQPGTKYMFLMQPRNYGVSLTVQGAEHIDPKADYAGCAKG